MDKQCARETSNNRSNSITSEALFLFSSPSFCNKKKNTLFSRRSEATLRICASSSTFFQPKPGKETTLTTRLAFGATFPHAFSAPNARKPSRLAPFETYLDSVAQKSEPFAAKAETPTNCPSWFSCAISSRRFGRVLLFARVFVCGQCVMVRFRPETFPLLHSRYPLSLFDRWAITEKEVSKSKSKMHSLAHHETEAANFNACLRV